MHLPTSFGDRFPHELSGGQRQRASLARALALNPKLLIADEPTSALDVSVQARVLELFAELQREFGFASLFISHDLAVVDQVADRVVVLRNGEIREQGTTVQVLTNPPDDYTKRLLAVAARARSGGAGQAPRCLEADARGLTPVVDDDWCRGRYRSGHDRPLRSAQRRARRGVPRRRSRPNG